MCGVNTCKEHSGGGRWEVMEWRGLYEAIFALAVPARHRTINTLITVIFCTLYGPPKLNSCCNLQNSGT
jgi:hypothetical protein